MRKVRSKGTQPEREFRRALRGSGTRFKGNVRDLPGKPDIVLRTEKLAVFLDGDFWHGGQWLRRRLSNLEQQFTRTRSKKYWLQKIRRNMARDATVTAELLESGWTVLRFWESDIRKNLGGCLTMTHRVLKRGVKTGVMSTLPDKTVAEFFAGIGLMRAGLENAGWRTLFANDNDPDKFEMYSANFTDADSRFRLCDVATLSSADIPSITLATASFPCNDLSLAGARQGLNGKQSSTFWSFVRLLQGMGSRKPPLVLIENVPGFLSSHDGKDLREAMFALNGLGYAMDAFLLDAASFVPQSRQRLFLIGTWDPSCPQSSAEELGALQPSETRPAALLDFIASHPQIYWKLRQLPPPPCSRVRLEGIVEDLPHGSPEWWSIERAQYLLNQMHPRHRKIAEFMISGRSFSYGTVFRRIRKEKSMAELRTDGIAGCLRTPRGGSGRQILVKAGRGKFFARLLTSRECARLMGADDYKLSVPLNQALFGFGDAVCVPAVEWITENYLNPLVTESIHSVPLVKARIA